MSSIAHLHEPSQQTEHRHVRAFVLPIAPADSDHECTIGFDLGGSHMTAGVVDRAGTVLGVRDGRRPPRTYQAMLDAIAALHAEVCDVAAGLGVQHRGIGMSVAAFLSRDRQHVNLSVNLPLSGQPLASDLARVLGQPVTLTNDGDAAAWGEYLHGAGQGASTLIVVTLGTGLGAGIVHQGRLMTGAAGLAGEIGHLAIARHGRACQCGSAGCLEQYVSGRALIRAARARARRAPESAIRLVELAGGSPVNIDGQVVTAAACAGDPAAREAFAYIGAHLGRGLGEAATILDPSTIVIAGGVAQAGELLLAPTREAFRRHVGVRRVRPSVQIVQATLGAHAGLLGAAALAAREIANQRR